MKRFIFIMLVLGYTSMAIVGIFLMNHADSEAHNGCIFATMQNVKCLLGNSDINVIFFHLNSLKNIATAYAENILFGLAMLLSLLVITYLALVRQISNLMPAVLYVKQLPNSFAYENSSSESRKKFLNWISLHENSPSAF